MSIYQTLKTEAEALFPTLVAWRRDFHQHPELGFQEVRTAGIVADHLRQLGLEVSTGVGKTGVVAMIENDQIDSDAPTVLLRFDMDALPILEQNDLPYRSQNAGVDACLRPRRAYGDRHGRGAIADPTPQYVAGAGKVGLSASRRRLRWCAGDDPGWGTE